MTSTSRRTLLRAGLAAGGAGLLGACDPDRPAPTVHHGSGASPGGLAIPDGFVSPTGAEVRAAEASRKPGRVRDFRLTATAGKVDLGGRIVDTWSYGGRIPGPPMRVTAGEVVRATLVNRLPAETTLHWHGIALRNDADGAPHLTQPPVASGAEFTYEFTAPHPGTYWFHPHSGAQLDRGLYAPLLVDDPQETLEYDGEWTVVLDDWLDGVAGTPDAALAKLQSGPGHGEQGGEGNSDVLGGPGGDVTHPHYLLNGRLPTSPETFRARPGGRVRLRLINAGADTAFRVALGGHRMTVTHTDGFPVKPVKTDALLLGMGERYDVLVDLRDGVFPLVALAEGKKGAAFGLVRTGGGTAPKPKVRPAALNGHIVGYHELEPADSVRLDDRQPDQVIQMELTGGTTGYSWGFNGRPLTHEQLTEHLVPIRAGELVQLDLVNAAHMWHPIHLHGHTFAVGSTAGPRKDTVNVLVEETVSVLFKADNPGLWVLHCHNVYHAESGMTAALGYRK
ncbi:multicopper oxidase family protein [Phytohabitans aurantiacus]|uniref:Multicopper oxidase MmcO n=1 Tax=Phytohabitans aurantiacus TaxID=3016789 RepID=A0ABQ5RA45_9ACTN|nr:multicopper oxidase family protein [Phytohabitans aurantiacus]GLI03476.1 multicopper oxidase MmcO [Phytohabitans aurantiacus]